MKKKCLIGLIALVMLVTYSFSGEKEFSKGATFITPQIALYSWALNFGASFEYALTANIGIGATLMYASWSENYWGMGKISESLITPSADFYYHFTQIEVDKLDLFAGASAGFSIYSWKWDYAGNDWVDAGSSGVFISPFIGGRYYISKTIAISLRLSSSLIGDWAGFGGLAGITIRLK